MWIFETNPYNDWNTLTIPTNDLEPGYYVIDLFMESQWTSVPGGCKAFKRDSILIKDAPDISNIDIIYSIDPPCGDNIEVTINAETESTNYTEITINDFPEDPTFNSFPVNHTLDFPLVYPVDIHLTNEIGCETDSTILLHTFPEPKADFIISPDTGCAPVEVIFEFNSSIPDVTENYIQSVINYGLDTPSFNPPGSWVWIYDDPSPNSDYQLNGNTANYTYKSSGTYNPSLEVTTNDGCSDIITKPVIVYPTPTADLQITPLGNGQYYFDGTGSQNAPLSDYYYYWSPENNYIYGGPPDPISAPWSGWIIENILNDNEYTHYYLSQLENANGREVKACLIIENKQGFVCVDTSCVDAIIYNFNGIWIPNALYPDESYHEYRYFLPKGASLKEYTLTIFDKFGNLVFKTNELSERGQPTEAWDGTKNGTPLPQGTYIWQISATFSDGTSWPGLGVGYGEATNGIDPYKGTTNEGRKSGALYLVR